jgi:hypothetical protein
VNAPFLCPNSSLSSKVSEAYPIVKTKKSDN